MSAALALLLVFLIPAAAVHAQVLSSTPTSATPGSAQADDIAFGSYGLNTLGIPGTNGPATLQGGIPTFAFSNGFSSLGNSNGASPFLFRDNQYTGNVNVSYTRGKHATKYGAEYYRFALNHFQPTSGINSPRGGFIFTGNLTALNGGANPNIYNSLADFELGDPNSVAKATDLIATNALRWSAFSFYAQDQWTITKKLTLNYGARYEYYPAPTRDHEGIFRFDPTRPFLSLRMSSLEASTASRIMQARMLGLAWSFRGSVSPTGSTSTSSFVPAAASRKIRITFASSATPILSTSHRTTPE